MSMDLVVSVRLSDVTAKALRRFAASENKKISVICRDIITQYFAEFDGENQWQKEMNYQLSKLQERVTKLEAEKQNSWEKEGVGRLGL